MKKLMNIPKIKFTTIICMIATIQILLPIKIFAADETVIASGSLTANRSNTANSGVTAFDSSLYDEIKITIVGQKKEEQKGTCYHLPQNGGNGTMYADGKTNMTAGISTSGGGLVSGYVFGYGGDGTSTKTINIRSLSGTQYVKAQMTCSTGAWCTTWGHGVDETFNGSVTGRYTIVGVSYKPAITSHPKDSITIEDKQAVFTCTASSGAMTYQWQKYDGYTWSNVDGATETALIINPVLADNGNLYRCIVTNSSGSTTSNSAKLTVASSSITDITVQYPLKEVDFNTVLRASDLYAVVKYNNGNALVSQNLDGLKFDAVSVELPDGTKKDIDNLDSVQYIFAALGNYTFTTKYTADITDPYSGTVSEKTFRPTFTVKCIDNTAPEIVLSKIVWEDGSEVTELTRDIDKKVTVQIVANDNVSSDAAIEFQWYKDNSDAPIKTFSNQNSVFTVTHDMGNGIYHVIAKDEAGNMSPPYQVNVTVWDIEPPTFVVDVPQIDEWTKFKKLNIYATDDIALNDTAYFIVRQSNTGIDYTKTDWIQESDWNSLNAATVIDNGTYTIYVRDKVNNISSHTVLINKIDAIAPVVQINAGKHKDLKSVLITVKAYDDGGSGLFYEDNQYKCFQANGHEIAIEDLGGYVKGSFRVAKNDIYTVFTKDNAGNIDSTSIVIDVDKILHGDNDTELTYIKNIRAENTDFISEYPDYTNKSIRLFAEIEEGLNLPSTAYSWDYEGDINEKWDGSGKWTNDNSLLVTENGVYTAYLRDTDDNVYRRSIEITTIDKISPVFTVTQQDNTLTIHASDAESGISKIMIAGGSQDTIQEKKYIYGFHEINENVIVSKNGEYRINIYDAAGNKSDTITKEVQSIPDTNYHTVTFCNYDGAILKSQKVKDNEDAAPPSVPSRKGYTFTGWDVPYTGIKEETKITAQFIKDTVVSSNNAGNGSGNTGNNGALNNKEKEEKPSFTVLFKTYDGSVIKSQTVEEGTDAAPPNSVKRDGYIFTGWSGSYSNIKADTEVTAKFEVDTSSVSSNSTADTSVKTSRGSISSSVVGSEFGDEEELVEEIEYINLTEYSDEARPLSISQEDLLQQQQSDTGDGNFPQEVEKVEMQQTNDKSDKEAIPVPIIIVALLGLAGTGAVVFYFLNKKYYWIALPF